VGIPLLYTIWEGLWLTPPIFLTTQSNTMTAQRLRKENTKLQTLHTKYGHQLTQLMTKMFNEVNDLEQWIFQISGVDSNLFNAQEKVRSVYNQLDEATNIAKELGYTSLLLALKALKQVKGLEISGLDLLPEDFHKVPNIWFDGKPDGKDPVRNPGFKPMSVSVAKRKLRVVQPLVVEAWQLADGDEDIQSTILTTYLTTSADEFEKTLYRYIYDLEEVSLEEELTNVLQPTNTEVEKTLKYMLDPNRIYGVVKKKINEEG